jgi:hypothetical protein
MSSVIARKDLKNFRRILVKVGTSVVIHSDGSVALGRIGHLVEQLSHIMVCIIRLRRASILRFDFLERGKP